MSLAEPSAGTRGNSNDHVRRHNLSTILGLVHRTRGLSRSQLTQAMGLNRSTIAALVSELVEHDLVREESAESTNQVGRPSPMVRPSSTPVGIAVNPEIDAITVGVVGLGGRVLRTERHQLTSPPTASDAVRVTAQILDGLRPELTLEHRIAGVGVAVPGLVRETDGLVRLAPHLGWRGEPFAEMLQQVTGLPVWAANDAHLGALAESSFGSGRAVSDLIYVNGGASGIGGGIITGGVPLLGTAGYAGELGHTMVNPTGIACHCGAFGCLETEVRRDRLLEVTGLSSQSVGRLAAALASSTDPRVAAEVTRQLDMLIVALRNVVNLLNPKLIVLGGFLAALQSAQPARLRDFGRNSALAASFDCVQIIPSELADDLLMIGAGELAFESLLADPAGFPLRSAP
ncbi:ROK family protein [Glaciihabitans sp. INWT7]|uniref:ROK family transcriptional regulator n=1 Tax=Glaciihabitans sp. INWT7 TaxID=2596912 RepID=UPI00162929FE|nr:ROK family transcriptional regulator [Glaciihabitans sp. INWT7]QNE45798.1 ROK family protein [Glaciihabitans sp. INWT7]